MDKALETFSVALKAQMKSQPALKLHLARGIHQTLETGGFKPPGTVVLLKRMDDNEGGGGGHHGGTGSGGSTGGGTTPAAPATPVTVEAFWWGFHFVIPHDALQVILFSGNAVNTFVELIGPETGPAAPFVELAAALVGKMLEIMRDMDTGKGIYFSMTWLLPGVFVPTPI